MSYPPVLIKLLKRLDAVVDPSEIDMILRRCLIVKCLGARQVVSRQEINIVDIRRDIRDDEQIELPVLLYPAAAAPVIKSSYLSSSLASLDAFARISLSRSPP